MPSFKADEANFCSHFLIEKSAIDVVGAVSVEVQMQADPRNNEQHLIRINLNGMCLLRISAIQRLVVEDSRIETPQNPI